RSSQVVGDIAAGYSEHSVSLAVEPSDFIGFWFFTGLGIRRDTVGFDGIAYKAGEYIDPGDENSYNVLDGDCVSLYGTGEAAA
ncbi:unnamed protein product, partial [marine sediment metagenome]